MGSLSFGSSSVFGKGFVDAGQRLLTTFVVDEVVESTDIVPNETNLTDVIPTRCDVKLLTALL